MRFNKIVSPALCLLMLLAACSGEEGIVPDTSPASVQLSDSAQAEQIELRREVFRYRGSGRDPFQSLVADGVSLRPFIQDLRVTSIIFDARYPSRSVGVLLDGSTNIRYEVRTGAGIGRLRIGQITESTIVITIVELGVPRQVELSIEKREGNR